MLNCITIVKDMLSRTKHYISVHVEIVLFKENKQWISYCPSLELSSYGDTQQEAKEAFDEALNIFLTEVERKGTLERELLRLGWQLQQKPKPIYNQPSLSLKKLPHKYEHVYKEKVAIPVA